MHPIKWFTSLDSTGYVLRITLPGACIDDCSRPGADVTDDVVTWVARLGFDADPADVRAYLRSTGGWAEEDLQEDHGRNLERLLWLIAFDLHREYHLGDDDDSGEEDPK